MIITLVLLSVLVFGNLAIYILCEDDPEFWHTILTLVVFILGGGLMIASQINSFQFTEVEFKSIKQTIETAREDDSISEIELAALQRDVIEVNKRLASFRYWNQNKFTSWFVYGGVKNLEPIKGRRNYE